MPRLVPFSKPGLDRTLIVMEQSDSTVSSRVTHAFPVLMDLTPLTPVEFAGLYKYVSDWRNVFFHFDRDRSGSIEGRELAEALRNFGYNLSPPLLTLVEQKYGKIAKFVLCHRSAQHTSPSRIWPSFSLRTSAGNHLRQICASVRRCEDAHRGIPEVSERLGS
jgi:hypothetical protein